MIMIATLELEASMLFHAVVITLMLSIVAAFLILWYLWIKKRLETAVCVEDDERVLFPFRHFSWLLLGVLVVTCLIQIHFVRVSSTVHERLTQMADVVEAKHADQADVSEIKALISAMKLDMNTAFDRIKTQAPDPGMLKTDLAARVPAGGPSESSTEGPALMSLSQGDRAKHDGRFASEAKASSLKKPEVLSERRTTASSSSLKATDPLKSSDKEQKKEESSMALALTGEVTAETLRMRRAPDMDAPVVAKLSSGEEVKVTEKRQLGSEMWYRVVAGSGKAGWVHFRFIKLRSAAANNMGS